MKIAIVDDQLLMVKGLSMILDGNEDMDIIWTSTSGQEALVKSSVNAPDVALLDIRMPGMDGIEVAEKLMAQFSEIKCIMLTTFDEEDLIYRALKLGVHGFLLKESTPDEIARAIRVSLTGGVSISPSVAAKMVHLLNEDRTFKDAEKEGALTNREMELAKYVSEGLNNKEIAEAMFLSEGTVKNHLTQILNKLDLRDRTQLAIWMLK